MSKRGAELESSIICSCHSSLSYPVLSYLFLTPLQSSSPWAESGGLSPLDSDRATRPQAPWAGPRAAPGPPLASQIGFQIAAQGGGPAAADAALQPGAAMAVGGGGGGGVAVVGAAGVRGGGEGAVLRKRLEWLMEALGARLDLTDGLQGDDASGAGAEGAEGVRVAVREAVGRWGGDNNDNDEGVLHEDGVSETGSTLEGAGGRGDGWGSVDAVKLREVAGMLGDYRALAGEWRAAAMARGAEGVAGYRDAVASMRAGREGEGEGEGGGSCVQKGEREEEGTASGDRVR